MLQKLAMALYQTYLLVRELEVTASLKECERALFKCPRKLQFLKFKRLTSLSLASARNPVSECITYLRDSISIINNLHNFQPEIF
jgi:hypothetical protein